MTGVLVFELEDELTKVCFNDPVAIKLEGSIEVNFLRNHRLAFDDNLCTSGTDYFQNRRSRLSSISSKMHLRASSFGIVCKHLDIGWQIREDSIFYLSGSCPHRLISQWVIGIQLCTGCLTPCIHHGCPTQHGSPHVKLRQFSLVNVLEGF